MKLTQKHRICLGVLATILLMCISTFAFLGGSSILQTGSPCRTLTHPNGSRINLELNEPVQSLVEEEFSFTVEFLDQELEPLNWSLDSQSQATSFYWAKEEISASKILYECHTTDIFRITSETGCIIVFESENKVFMKIVRYNSDLPCKRA